MPPIKPMKNNSIDKERKRDGESEREREKLEVEWTDLLKPTLCSACNAFMSSTSGHMSSFSIFEV